MRVNQTPSLPSTPLNYHKPTFPYRSLTSCDEVLKDLFFPVQVDFQVVFLRLYDFRPQITQIYVDRMANSLFFLFPDFCAHGIHLPAIFSSTTRTAAMITRYTVYTSLIPNKICIAGWESRNSANEKTREAGPKSSRKSWKLKYRLTDPAAML